ncbi:S1 family peptidase [Actinomadura sp. 1N219]|uniref:S1 family peptidase n=1 Tax=Actinomadura sp. 1N219 TaxID=3375152 RepID=UPI00379693F4
MRKHILLAAVPIAVLTLSGTSVAAAAEPPPPPRTTIVGGVPATETYTFMTSLQQGGRHGCGGSLVGASWVVTAEHCGQPTQVRIGTRTWNAGGEVRSVASRQVLGGDVALLRLSSPSAMKPISIAASAPVGSATRLIGWGQTCPTRGCGGPPVQLQQLDTTIVEPGRCDGIQDAEICTDGGNGRGACYGDSGGPAVTGGPGAWELVGATSRGGDTCAQAPAIYGDVTAYREQIMRIIGGGAAANR